LKIKIEAQDKEIFERHENRVVFFVWFNELIIYYD